MEVNCYTSKNGTGFITGDYVHIISTYGSEYIGHIQKISETCIYMLKESSTSTHVYSVNIPFDEISEISHVYNSTKPQVDMVSHPPHYQSETGLEVIDVIEAFTFDLKGIEATDTGNIIKYICRWKQKNGVEDLRKAKWYLEHLINHVELLEKENG